jgi:SpoIID/LytB domain protein
VASGPQNPEPQNPEPRTPNPEPHLQPASGDVIRVGVAKPGGSYSIVAIPVEAYVARVLAGEAVRNSEPAALEALAITVRTFAAANRGRHRADGFDLCDQTHCQVLRTATPATERAANATAGRLLVRDGAAALVYYSASCGGHTAMPSEVWPGHDDPSYLPSRRDDACEGAPLWTAELHESDVGRALRAAGFRGTLRDVRVAARDGSGRVARLHLDGLTPDHISGQDLRVAVGRTLGWQHVKSAVFELQRRGDTYRFSGRGSGHGVGLCVIGSAKLAERGVSVEAILARYFPGLEVSAAVAANRVRPSPDAPGGRSTSDPAAVAAPPAGAPAPARAPSRAPTSHPVATNAVATAVDSGIALTLPDDDEGERAAIEKQTLKARDDLARALGVAAPARVTLRFHPTTDAYEQATGRAWFTSASIVNGDLHLLPLATLRDRGVLERTIRHELVHLMTDGVLATRRQWVREGAAIYFAGDPPLAGQPQQRPAFTAPPKASCPTDTELLQPVSVGALANAYARARACFTKQIQSGKVWRDVR